MNPQVLPHVLYYIVMAIAVSGWLALIVFPRRPWANFWYAGAIAPVLLCLIYMYSLLSFWFLNPAGRFGEFLSLEGVHSLFENRGLLLVGWINLIAMDLVVGAWMTRRAAQARIPYVYLLPTLILTFIFAGFGFALFAVICAAGGRWPSIARFEGIPDTESPPVWALPTATNTR